MQEQDTIEQIAMRSQMKRNLLRYNQLIANNALTSGART